MKVGMQHTINDVTKSEQPKKKKKKKNTRHCKSCILAVVADCPDGFLVHRDSCYKEFGIKTTWAEASVGFTLRQHINFPCVF